MGRTILADERIQAYVENLLQSKTWFLGVIIGKLTSQKDFAVHLVRTPEPLDDQASSDDDEAATVSERKKRRRSQTKPSELGDMQVEQWAATHARQVTMMLPGGLNVIGIFAVAPPAMMQAAQSKLRQVLFAIQKQEKKSQMSELGDSIGDRILLQICSSTRKPAEWKTQGGQERWQRLETQMAVNIPLNIAQTSRQTGLAKQIQVGLQPYIGRVCTSLILVDDSLRQEVDALDQSTEKRGKSRDKVTTENQSAHKCSVLLKQGTSGDVPEPSVKVCSTQLVIKGTLHGRAYVTSKATVADAQNSMRTDIVRSVLSRCELLSDDIQVVEEDVESHEVYSTPRRVFFPLPGTSLQLCDYMFQDEKASEVKGRVRELLDLKLEDDDLDFTHERPPTEEDCSQLVATETESGEVKGDNSNGAPGMKYYMMAGIGAVTAFLAAGLSYIYGQDT
ncbi:ODR4-like protein [Mya arenaria]|uniref:ODR4-like protein n=1 Tax=Mya arenaria TaxID=6604 RepID=A0ABY7GAZ8_MYAAR|nr:ODR4-like protein [Mya arenaria]